jgi:hypothetical protein
VDAADVLAKARVASGGEQWLSVQRLQAVGEQSVGGLHGRWQLNQDLRAGRYAEQAQLGDFTVAQGFDGQLSWRRDYGGEVGLLDGTVPRRTARTQSWLATRAYWSNAYPTTHFAAPRTEALDGRRYTVLATKPEGAGRSSSGSIRAAACSAAWSLHPLAHPPPPHWRTTGRSKACCCPIASSPTPSMPGAVLIRDCAAMYRCSATGWMAR